MTETSRTTTTRTRSSGDDVYDRADIERTIGWLTAEFPGWIIEVEETATWEGDLRALWLARRPGHHPQAELTPAKLHSRLSDYLEREERRRPQSN